MSFFTYVFDPVGSSESSLPPIIMIIPSIEIAAKALRAGSKLPTIVQVPSLNFAIFAVRSIDVGADPADAPAIFVVPLIIYTLVSVDTDA